VCIRRPLTVAGLNGSSTCRHSRAVFLRASIGLLFSPLTSATTERAASRMRRGALPRPLALEYFRDDIFLMQFARQRHLSFITCEEGQGCRPRPNGLPDLVIDESDVPAVETPPPAPPPSQPPPARNSIPSSNRDELRSRPLLPRLNCRRNTIPAPEPQPGPPEIGLILRTTASFLPRKRRLEMPI